MRRLWAVLIVLSFALLPMVTQAQDDPNRLQTYRLVRITDNEDATSMHWIEIWESQDYAQGARQIVMVEARSRGVDQGVEAMCYYAMSQGGGVFYYMVDGELISVNNASTFWDELQNRRIFAQSEMFATDIGDCTPGDIKIVNGFLAQSCAFENADASYLFHIHPPATATGTLWTATSETSYAGFPVRYEFAAQGEKTEVRHRYEAFIEPEGFDIAPPTNIHLLCFDDGFPVTEMIQPVATNNLTYASYTTHLNVGDLKMTLDAALLNDWDSAESDLENTLAYARTLESGTECNLLLRLTSSEDGGTDFVVEVFPRTVNLESVPLPQPIGPVVQSVNVPFIVAGLGEVLDSIVPAQEAEGWTIRDELTDIREDAAFITLSRGGEAMHIVVEGNAARLQTRQAVCGPTFLVGEN